MATDGPAPGEDLEAYWAVRTPENPLPIEEFVGKLLKKSSRPNERLRKGYAGNPYKAARLAVMLALARAQMELKRDADARATLIPALDAIHNDAVALRQRIKSFVTQYPADRIVRHMSRGAERPHHEAENAARKRVRVALQAVLDAPLDVILAEVAISKQSMRLEKRTGGSHGANPFAQAFTESLGFSWHDLTDSAPNNGKRFREFVRAAHETAVAATQDGAAASVLPATADLDGWRRLLSWAKSVKWANQIRETVDRVKDRPTWNRWERYAKDLWPPGTQFDERTEEERQAWRRERAAEARRDVDEMIETAKGAGGDAPAARALLRLAYRQADETERRRMLAKGYQPERDV